MPFYFITTDINKYDHPRYYKLKKPSFASMEKIWGKLSTTFKIKSAYLS